MARVKKTKNVAKFGGVDDLGKVKTDLHSAFGVSSSYDTSSVEAKSKVHLEMDKGEGNAVVIRRFSFGINPQVWLEHPPTKQDLFNHHIKGIEMALFRDGLKLYLESQPRIVVSNTNYEIFIAAVPKKGYLLKERPQTLGEIAHG